MAAIQNQADVILQATSPRLLSNPLNYISIIPSTNTITNTSGSLIPSTVTVKAILNGSIRGTINWSTSPSVVFTNITDGIVMNSSVVTNGASVVVTASITFNGNTYTSSTTITRKQAITLNSNGTLSGEGGGAITGLDYSNVSGTKPPATATSNFFTTSTSNPSGGNDGDAHYNSSTMVMWFKTGGSWNAGGTINASQITTGTLAAARIAAGSIDATKLNVSTLSAITANLGSVNAGSITGTANINITGSAVFNGSISAGGNNYCAVVNTSLSQPNGLYSVTNTGFSVHGTTSGVGVGVLGITSGTSSGVQGTSTSLSGTGVVASNSAGGRAINIASGYMTINSTALVSNLNADMVDGLHASTFVRTDINSAVTGNIDITGTLQVDNLRIDKTPTTGSGTANFVAASKPGGTSSVRWIDINCNGTTYYLAVWT